MVSGRLVTENRSEPSKPAVEVLSSLEIKDAPEANRVIRVPRFDGSNEVRLASVRRCWIAMSGTKDVVILVAVEVKAIHFEFRSCWRRFEPEIPSLVNPNRAQKTAGTIIGNIRGPSPIWKAVAQKFEHILLALVVVKFAPPNRAAASPDCKRYCVNLSVGPHCARPRARRSVVVRLSGGV